MIEVLGIGIADGATDWLMRRVCARISPGALTLVVSPRAQGRRAFLDALAGRRVPQEGRVWVNGIPVTRETAGWLRRRVAEVELSAPLLEHRSLLWNTLAVAPRGLRTMRGCIRLPQPAARRAAAAALESVELGGDVGQPVSALPGWGRMHVRIARALARRPECLLAREVDLALPAEEAQAVLTLLRGVARRLSLMAIASVEDEWLAHCAGDHVVTLDGCGLASTAFDRRDSEIGA
ncbi:MAG TPA: ATP-binding cassette domain-containing protein [Methylomirabilota bacterium]